MGCKMRGLAGDLIVQVYSVDESKGTEFPMVMIGPMKGGIYRNVTSSADDMLDVILRESIVVMSDHTAVLDYLALRGQFSGKILRSVDPIVGVVVTDLKAHGDSLALEANLSLKILSPVEIDLVNHSELGTSSIAKIWCHRKTSMH